MRDQHYPYRAYAPFTKLSAFPDQNLVAFCAEEVRRQQDTPWHVYRLWAAFKFAIRKRPFQKRLTEADVLHIASIIDEANEKGYRKGPVWIGGEARNNHWSIHLQVPELLERQEALTPDEFYYRFEILHPFNDGNGRTGKVLFNWLNDTLEDPEWPSDHFGGIENP